jgi:hypothetical protein
LNLLSRFTITEDEQKGVGFRGCYDLIEAREVSLEQLGQTPTKETAK